MVVMVCIVFRRVLILFSGTYLRKLGEPSQTPYPIGIDISKNGDILVADTHGNHLHVVVFSSEGRLIQSFTHNEFRVGLLVDVIFILSFSFLDVLVYE